MHGVGRLWAGGVKACAHASVCPRCPQLLLCGGGRPQLGSCWPRVPHPCPLRPWSSRAASPNSALGAGPWVVADQDWGSWEAAWRRRSDSPEDRQGLGRQQGGGGRRGTEGLDLFLSSCQWNLPLEAGWSVVFRPASEERGHQTSTCFGVPTLPLPPENRGQAQLDRSSKPQKEQPSRRGDQSPVVRTSPRSVPAAGTTFTPSRQVPALC